jgi:hypothetical protein
MRRRADQLRADQLPRPTLVDEPFPATRDDYRRILAATRERIRGWPGLRQVLQFGGVAAPGISDIDLLLVFDDDVDWRQLDGADLQAAFPRPYFLHLPFAIQASCLPRAGDLFHFERLTDLDSGTDLPLAQPPADAVLCWNYGAALTMVRALVRELSAPQLRARALLCFLGAVRHNVELVSGRIADRRFAEFRDEVGELRSSWVPHRRDNLDRLLTAAHSALAVLELILRGYAALVADLLPGAPPLPCTVALAPFDLVVHYGAPPPPAASAIRLQRDPWTGLRCTAIDLPAACAPLHVRRLLQLPRLGGGLPATIEPSAAAAQLAAAPLDPAFEAALQRVAETEQHYARFMTCCPLPFQYLSPGAAFDRRPLNMRQRLGRLARRVIFRRSA